MSHARWIRLALAALILLALPRPAAPGNPLAVQATLLLVEGAHPRSFKPRESPITSMREALGAGLVERVAESTVFVVPGQTQPFTLALADDSSTTGSLRLQLKQLKGELTVDLPTGIPGYFAPPVRYSLPAVAPQDVIVAFGEHSIKERRRSGIPGVRRLPVIGKLFGSYR